MKLPEPDNPQSRLQRSARVYSEMIRVGVISLAWTLAAFLAACVAYLIVRVTLTYLGMLLKAVGEI